MNTTAPNIYLLIVAGVSLVIGLVILVVVNRRSFTGSILALTHVCWIFIALFPVFMIFSFFSDNSTVSGKFFGFSVGGAIGAFVLIWWFGAGRYINAHSKDELNKTIQDLESKLTSVQTINKPKREILPDGKTHEYKLAENKNKKIILLTGNISAAEKIDVWVNSENTNMQMPGYFDRSISGTIRFYGAKRDVDGKISDDVINRELIKEMDGRVSVLPATVFVTGSGELEKSNNVKRIFHVASVQGTPGEGYVPVKNIAGCVKNALAKADLPELAGLKLRSILFPLLGTGQGAGDLSETVTTLMESALSFMEKHPESNIESVYFLTRFDDQLAVCREVLDAYKPERLVSN